MSFITLTRVPFGVFDVRAEHVGAVTAAATDPFCGMYNGAPYGACVLVQGIEYRVKETAQDVRKWVLEALGPQATPRHVPAPVYGPTTLPDVQIQGVTLSPAQQSRLTQALVEGAAPKRGKKK